jgi:SSS family solute:Na+ symporter
VASGLAVDGGLGAESSEYFLAGRGLGWPVIGLALFATNISTVHVIGLAGSGFGVGLVIGNFEWLAPFFLALLGVVFAPFYFTNGISTLPEYIERRFSPASRTFLAFTGIVGAMFLHLGTALYAGAMTIQAFFEVDLRHSSCFSACRSSGYFFSF